MSAQSDEQVPIEVNYCETQFDRQSIDYDGTVHIYGLPYRAVHHGMQAAATTPEGAVVMIRRMADRRRAESGQSDEQVERVADLMALHADEWGQPDGTWKCGCGAPLGRDDGHLENRQRTHQAEVIDRAGLLSRPGSEADRG